MGLRGRGGRDRLSQIIARNKREVEAKCKVEQIEQNAEEEKQRIEEEEQLAQAYSQLKEARDSLAKLSQDLQNVQKTRDHGKVEQGVDPYDFVKETFSKETV